MYRDSVNGLTIDLAGPDGNAFVLIGIGRRWCRELGKDPDTFAAKMKSGDYNNALDVFESYFKHIVTLENDPRKADPDSDTEEA